jgi:hypothetical protein
MRIVTLIPVYKRPEVLRLCIENLKIFTKKVKTWKLTPVFLLSPEDIYLKENEKLVKEAGYRAIYYPNLPVSNKMNAGIRYVYEHYNFDYLMNFGSDDLIHPEIETLYRDCFANGVKFFGINTLYFYEMATGKTIFFDTYNTNGSIGAARMIHRSLLDWFIENDYPLYEPGLDCGLDTSSAMMLKRTLNAFDVILDSGTFPYVVDVKTDTNINHMMYLEQRTKNITYIDHQFLKTYYEIL